MARVALFAYNPFPKFCDPDCNFLSITEKVQSETHEEKKTSYV